MWTLLDHSGCYNKNTTGRQLKPHSLLTVWRPAHSVWWGPASGSQQCPRVVEEARERSGVSSTRALIPSTRASPPQPNHLLKPPPPKPSHWGLEFQHMNFRGGHKHSIHNMDQARNMACGSSDDRLEGATTVLLGGGTEVQRSCNIFFYIETM